MTTLSIDEERQQAIAQATRGIRPTHIYYRQPNGWITFGAATMIERAKFQAEGWQPLTDYPSFDFANVWASDNPHVTLFQFGGAKEMPLDQIIAHGYHFWPPLVPTCRQPRTEKHSHSRACYIGARPVEFPQLEGMELPERPVCRFCGRDTLATMEARDQHERVAHKDEIGNVRTGEVLAENLVKGLRGGNQAETPLSTSGEPYVCGFCMAGFSNLVAFGKHVQEEQEARQ